MSKLPKINYNLQYDPNDVDIRLQHFTVGDIIALIEKGKLEIIEENDLQRLPDLWDDKRKSLLIESLMINLPLPIFYLDGSEKIWTVVDGLQRLGTLYQYISSESPMKFTLKKLEYLKDEFQNFPFEKLPLYMRNRIIQSPIEAYVINPGTPIAVKYNIFQRINTLGLKLNGQEVRNAVYRGIPSNFTKELAIDPAFVKATNGKVTIKRMIDREYTTRFIAFQLFKDDYSSDIDEFLRQTMEYLYSSKSNERDFLKKMFHLSMKRSYELLGPFCFYRFKEDGTIKGRTPNKALFDTLSWNMSKLNISKYNSLLSKKSFKKKYIDFMNDDDFFKAINDTTSSTTSVLNRFNLLQEFLGKFI